MPLWTLGIIIPVAVITLVVTILAVVFLGLARNLGWNRLRGHYGAPPEFEGRSVASGSFDLDQAQIRHCGVSFGFGDDGLHLLGSRWFGMPPVRVPWSDVRLDPSDPHVLLVGPNRTRLRVRGSLLMRVLAHLEAATASAGEAKAAPTVKATAASTAPDRCPYCHDQLSGVLGACVACGTQHHAECLMENNGCAVLACTAGPQERPQRSEKA